MNNNAGNQAVNFFKDADGNLTIWQRPNVPLVGWVLFMVLSMVVNSNSIKNWFANISMALLFTWAYLEITKGSSYFRRLLGVLVITALIIGYYKRN